MNLDYIENKKDWAHFNIGTIYSPGFKPTNVTIHLHRIIDKQHIEIEVKGDKDNFLAGLIQNKKKIKVEFDSNDQLFIKFKTITIFLKDFIFNKADDYEQLWKYFSGFDVFRV